MAPIPANIWNQYVSESGSGTASSAQTASGRTYFQLFCNGRILKYAVAVYGARPASGYPLYVCFCGGGEDKKPVPNANDSSWWDVFDRFYGLPVAQKAPCVFVAARGISAYAGDLVDTYDLHSQPESYVLLQRMIMNLLLPQPTEFKSQAGNATASYVNPDQVYLLGFSAGGNGVYQLSTKISDRCAAVVAGGGHPEAAPFENLANLPTRLQCGGNDIVTGWNNSKFPRANVTIGVDNQLVNLASLYGASLFPHRTDIVQNGSHAGWAQPTQVNNPQPLIKNLNAWLSKGVGANDITTEVINPENWVASITRNPIPPVVVWNLASRPPSLGPAGPATVPLGVQSTQWQSKDFFYWLYIRDATSKDYNSTDVILATYGKDATSNWIKIQKPVAYLGFLLNTDMADFSKPLKVYDWNANQLGSVVLGSPSSSLALDTLRARGDPSMVFSKMVYLTGSAATSWTVQVADTLTPAGGNKAML